MAAGVLKQIGALMRQQQIGEAIALCTAEIEKPQDPATVPHVVATLCVCLAGTGRIDDAAAVYETHRAALTGTDDLAVMAAMAARHAPDIQNRFRRTAQFHGDQPVGFSPLATIADWCAHHGIARTMIDPAQEIVPADPAHKPYVTEPFHAQVLPNAEILSGWDFVFTPDGYFLADSGYMPVNLYYGVFPYQLAENLNLLAHIWPTDVQEIPGTVLFLSTPRAFHVGHFLVDFLPRLRGLDGHPDAKIALPTEAPQKYHDLLVLFGIHRDRIVACDLGKRYRFEKLIVTQVGDIMRPNPQHVRFIRGALGPGTPATPQGRALFLQRGVGTRQIENQAEVDQVLTEYGIEKLDLEPLSIPAQRAALAQARLIVGVFGSDLLGALFAPPGAHVIEMIWDVAEDPVVGTSCEFSGIHHAFLVCESARESAKQRLKKDRDVVVDCGALRTRLARITQRLQASFPGG